MTRREWRQEFKRIFEKNAWAEKFDEEKRSLPKKIKEPSGRDWKAFSRWRGYTEAEIADFERSLELYEIGLKLGYTDGEMYWISGQVIKKVWKARGIKMVKIDGELKIVIGQQTVTSGNRGKRKNV